MNEELYQPLPDIDAYLDRIGIEKAEEPTALFLDKLIYAHQTHVPFENLDIYEKDLVPSLGTEDLFSKIVSRKRGGYCFELNALFCSLLKALGYKITAYLARTQLRPLPYPACSHRVNIVTIASSRYLVDVGFGGPMAPFALLMENNATRTENGQTFTMHHLDASNESWWELGYKGSMEEKRVLRVFDQPVNEEDFIALSFYQAKSPDSVFKNNRIVNIRTADGARSLRNSTYTEHCNGKKSVTEIGNEEEITGLLHDKFGIRV